MDRVTTQLGGTNQSDNASGQSFRVNAISELVIATVKVFINNKLHLTLATTSPNLKFSQPLPNRKVVTVKVEATDAVGNRKTQEITIRR